MHRSARVMVSAFALLLVAAFAIVPGTARANMDKPTWAAGDFWVYSFVSGSGGLTLNGTLRLDVTGTETVTLNQTDYPCYHVAADLKIPFGAGLSYELTPDIWFSTATLAIVKIRAVVAPIANLTTQTTVVIAGSPPQTIHWPLTAGVTWTDSTVVWTSSTNATRTTWSHATLMTASKSSPTRHFGAQRNLYHHAGQRDEYCEPHLHDELLVGAGRQLGTGGRL